MKPIVPSGAEFNQQESSPLRLAHNQMLLESHDLSPQGERNFDFRPPPSLLVALPAVIPHTHSRGSSGSGVLWLWLYLSRWETLGPCKLPPNPKPEGAGPALSRSTVSRSQRSKRSLRTLQLMPTPMPNTHAQASVASTSQRTCSHPSAQHHRETELPLTQLQHRVCGQRMGHPDWWEDPERTRLGTPWPWPQGERPFLPSCPYIPAGALLGSHPSIPSERNRSKLKFYTLKRYFPVEIISTMISKTYIYNAKAPTHHTPVPKTIKGEL